MWSKGKRSRNKASVGEPADGSLRVFFLKFLYFLLFCKFLWKIYEKCFCVYGTITTHTPHQTCAEFFFWRTFLKLFAFLHTRTKVFFTAISRSAEVYLITLRQVYFCLRFGNLFRQARYLLFVVYWTNAQSFLNARLKNYSVTFLRVREITLTSFFSLFGFIILLWFRKIKQARLSFQKNLFFWPNQPPCDVWVWQTHTRTPLDVFFFHTRLCVKKFCKYYTLPPFFVKHTFFVDAFKCTEILCAEYCFKRKSTFFLTLAWTNFLTWCVMNYAQYVFFATMCAQFFWR